MLATLRHSMALSISGCSTGEEVRRGCVRRRRRSRGSLSRLLGHVAMLCLREPHLKLCHHHEAIRQLIGVAFQQLANRVDLCRRPFVGKSEKYHTAMWIKFTKHHFPEVAIVGNQNPVLGKRLAENGGVIESTASSYTENTSCPWSRNHWATLGPVHSSTRNRIHAVSASGMNVVLPRDCDANSKQA